MSGQLYDPDSLPRWEGGTAPYPLNRWLSKWVPESVWMLRRRETSLAFAENWTTFPRTSSHWPSHYTDHATNFSTGPFWPRSTGRQRVFFVA